MKNINKLVISNRLCVNFRGFLKQQYFIDKFLNIFRFFLILEKNYQ